MNQLETALKALTITPMGMMYAEQADAYDQWGSLMDWTFNVCDLMHLRGMPIPQALGYAPGMGLSEPEDWSALDYAEDASVEELTSHALALNAALDACVDAGIDY